MTFTSKKVLILAVTVLISLTVFGSCSYAAENGLVAHYKFTGDLNDSSGNNNNGEAVGDVSLTGDSVAGTCAAFNGGYLDVPSKPALNLGGAFTISAWVLVDPVNGKGNKVLPIISKLDTRGNYNNYIVFARGDFTARMNLKFVSTGDVNITGGAFDNYALSSKWTHIVYMYDGKRLYMYVDGVVRGMKDVKNGDSILASSGKMRIGTGNDLNNHNLFFMGKMADLRLYNRALDSAEIKALGNVDALISR